MAFRKVVIIGLVLAAVSFAVTFGKGHTKPLSEETTWTCPNEQLDRPDPVFFGVFSNSCPSEPVCATDCIPQSDHHFFDAYYIHKWTHSPLKISACAHDPRTLAAYLYRGILSDDEIIHSVCRTNLSQIQWDPCGVLIFDYTYGPGWYTIVVTSFSTTEEWEASNKSKLYDLTVTVVDDQGTLFSCSGVPDTTAAPPTWTAPPPTWTPNPPGQQLVGRSELWDNTANSGVSAQISCPSSYCNWYSYFTPPPPDAISAHKYNTHKQLHVGVDMADCGPVAGISDALVSALTQMMQAALVQIFGGPNSTPPPTYTPGAPTPTFPPPIDDAGLLESLFYCDECDGGADYNQHLEVGVVLSSLVDADKVLRWQGYSRWNTPYGGGKRWLGHVDPSVSREYRVSVVSAAELPAWLYCEALAIISQQPTFPSGSCGFFYLEGASVEYTFVDLYPSQAPFYHSRRQHAFAGALTTDQTTKNELRGYVLDPKVYASICALPALLESPQTRLPIDLRYGNINVGAFLQLLGSIVHPREMGGQYRTSQYFVAQSGPAPAFEFCGPEFSSRVSYCQ